MGLCHYISLKMSGKEWTEYISKRMHGVPEMKLNQEKLEQFDIETTVKKLEEICPFI